MYSYGYITIYSPTLLDIWLDIFVNADVQNILYDHRVIDYILWKVQNENYAFK